VEAASETRTLIERYLHEVLAGTSENAVDGLVADASLRQSLATYRRAFGALEVTPHVIVVAGDYAAAHVSVRGTHRGLFQGVRATGLPWISACSAIFRLDGGRIVDSWVTWDTLSILEQIGAIGRPPGASA
jgi:predicted ester cyclase